MLTAVSCATSSRCAAVGTAPDGSAIAYDTSNGGKTWRRSSVPGSSGPLEALACERSGTCIAVGSHTLLVSVDSGARWRSVHYLASRSDLTAVSCPSSAVCVTAGMTEDIFSAPAAVILRSTDSGATWSPEPVPPGTQGLEALACTRSGMCVTAGTNMLMSSDSGARWHASFAPGGISSAMDAASCTKRSICIISAGPSQHTPRYLVILDPTASIQWVQLPAHVPGLRAISCYSKGSCLGISEGANSSRSRIVMLKASGSAVVSTLTHRQGHLDAIWCENSGALCIAAGGTRQGAEVLRSTDEGSTWVMSRL